MRNDVREFRAVPMELVPDALLTRTLLAPAIVRAPAATPRAVARARHRCQMMMVVDQLALR